MKSPPASLPAMTGARPPLFDFRIARMRQLRASRLDGDRFLDHAAGDGLAGRLETVTRRFEQGLVIGDAVPQTLRRFAANWSLADFDRDEVLGAEAGRFDLAMSIFSLQAINDLPGALAQIRRALKPDGLFLGTLLGGATLTELRDSFAVAESESLGGISPHVSPFADVRDLGGLLLRAGFALPVADRERTQARYRDFTGLARDLRAHGLTNVMAERRKMFLRRNTLAAMQAHYRAHHATEAKLNATFEIITLTGWAPDASQQQPLKPGSARTRLADALGTVEHKAGDVTGVPASRPRS
jgi:SAM-dependent methyltransferase